MTPEEILDGRGQVVLPVSIKVTDTKDGKRIDVHVYAQTVAQAVLQTAEAYEQMAEKFRTTGYPVEADKYRTPSDGHVRGEQQEAV